MKVSVSESVKMWVEMSSHSIAGGETMNRAVMKGSETEERMERMEGGLIRRVVDAGHG